MSSAYDLACLKHRPIAVHPLGQDSATARDLVTRASATYAGTVSIGPPVAPGLRESHNLSASNSVVGFGFAPGAIWASGLPVSVDGWVWPTSWQTASGAYAFSVWTATQNRQLMFSLGPENGGYINVNSAISSGGGQFNSQVSDLSYVGLNKPHYIAVVGTVDDTISIYLNGQRVWGPVAWPNRHGGNGTPRVGRPADTFWGMVAGYYSNWCIYPKSLTSGDIMEHWELGMGHLDAQTRPWLGLAA